MRPTVTTCAYCGAEFPVPNDKGPIPLYCRRSHRQRAWEKATERRDRKQPTR